MERPGCQGGIQHTILNLRPTVIQSLSGVSCTLRQHYLVGHLAVIYTHKKTCSSVRTTELQELSDLYVDVVVCVVPLKAGK